MQSRDNFPLGVAAKSAFCNRHKETAWLVSNIQHGKHSLLMGPRRYGKSSLALHCLKQAGLPYTEVDFYMACDERAVENYILSGVTQLIGKALGPADKLVATIKQYVKHLKPSLEIGSGPLCLALSAGETADPAAHIKEALMLLEHLLSEKKQRAVLLLDEFQNVGVIAKGVGVEGAIRHVAQKTKYLSIIFSGSSRNLLATMFEDETRPLYKLCWKWSLERISAEHYHKHLQKIAKKTWAENLSEVVIDEILKLSERHPFYVNKLCELVWTMHPKKLPTVLGVKKAWQAILDEEKSDAIREISLLSLNQKNLLQHIAEGQVKQLTSKQTVLLLQIPSSSVATALDGLEEKDIVEKQETGYHIINPIVRHYARVN